MQHTLSVSCADVDTGLLARSELSLKAGSPREGSLRLLLGDLSKLAIPDTCVAMFTVQCNAPTKDAVSSPSSVCKV